MAKHFLEGRIASLSKGKLELLYHAWNFKEESHSIVRWEISLKNHKTMRHAVYALLRDGYEKDDFVTLVYTPQNGVVVYGPMSCYAYNDDREIAGIFELLQEPAPSKKSLQTSRAPSLF